MSRESQIASDLGEEYLQSPADDIESFLWVALYAVAKSSMAADRSLQKMYTDSGRDKALHLIKTRPSLPGSDLSGFFDSYLARVDKLMNRQRNDKVSLTENNDVNAWNLFYLSMAVSGFLVALDVVVQTRRMLSTDHGG